MAWPRQSPKNGSIPVSRAAPDQLIMKLAVPAHFQCPISLELMQDPVVGSTGITYDRASIEAWLATGHPTCPVTHRELNSDELVPNHVIRQMIQDWCVANSALVVERVPTPRIPVTSAHASEAVAEVDAARLSGDAELCRRAAAKIKNASKEADRNRRCFVSAKAGRALVAAFDAFASEASHGDPTGEALATILSALACMLPLDEDDIAVLASPRALSSLAGVCKSGEVAATRLNALLVINNVVSSTFSRAILDTAPTIKEEVVEALAKLIAEPVLRPQAARTALAAANTLAGSDERVAAQLARSTGVVPALLEGLVDAEKSTCEKALAVLDAVLSSEEGRDQARAHALAVPVLVKKVLRVSEAATDLAVSALWRLLRRHEGVDVGEREEMRADCLREALQVGAFQKLLLLLQIGCGGAAKEKGTELLKLLNSLKPGACNHYSDNLKLNSL